MKIFNDVVETRGLIPCLGTDGYRPTDETSHFQVVDNYYGDGLAVVLRKDEY